MHTGSAGEQQRACHAALFDRIRCDRHARSRGTHAQHASAKENLARKTTFFPLRARVARGACPSCTSSSCTSSSRTCSSRACSSEACSSHVRTVRPGAAGDALCGTRGLRIRDCGADCGARRGDHAHPGSAWISTMETSRSEPSRSEPRKPARQDRCRRSAAQRGDQRHGSQEQQPGRHADQPPAPERPCTQGGSVGGSGSIHGGGNARRGAGRRDHGSGRSRGMSEPLTHGRRRSAHALADRAAERPDPGAAHANAMIRRCVLSEKTGWQPVQLVWPSRGSGHGPGSERLRRGSSDVVCLHRTRAGAPSPGRACRGAAQP